jgi:pimeloyl-ACP methyl ester carboxylesterase
MGRKIVFLLLCLLGLVLLVQPATAVQPTIPTGNCDPDGLQSSGAIYRICVPGNWNGDLIVYAHGYVSPTEPVGIPEDQIVIGGSSIIDLVNLLGYAFATTSYSDNGLVIQPGIEDIVDLVAIFETQYGQPNQTFLAGVSEGGIITALTIERYPDLFDGGLAMCGPYGDFSEQINYFGDFRILFDYYFPGLMPGEPTEIPPALIADWDNHYTTTIEPEITDPTNTDIVAELLTVAGAPFEPTYPLTNTATIEGLLWYNVFATNDGTIKLGGQPFSNTHRIYTGSADDVALNAGVARYDGDPTALTEMTENYLTSGDITVPIVTLHTTADPIVPYWHSTLYTDKISHPALYEHFPADRYGHCFFTVAEILTAYGRLLELAAPQKSYLPIIFSKAGSAK